MTFQVDGYKVTLGLLLLLLVLGEVISLAQLRDDNRTLMWAIAREDECQKLQATPRPLEYFGYESRPQHESERNLKKLGKPWNQSVSYGF